MASSVACKAELHLVDALLSHLNAGMRRQQRCLPYAQRLASPLDGAMNIAGLVITDADVETRLSLIGMILRQNTPPKFERLLEQRKSIVAPPKIIVRGGQIVH